MAEELYIAVTMKPSSLGNERIRCGFVPVARSIYLMTRSEGTSSLKPSQQKQDIHLPSKSNADSNGNLFNLGMNGMDTPSAQPFPQCLRYRAAPPFKGR